ncbi:MAG: hypothetical protein AB8H80_01295 [Planctomycetota bacterium]
MIKTLTFGLTGALLCHSLAAQAPAKVMRFDTGNLWYSAVSLSAVGGDLDIHGNFAIGGGTTLLQTGVVDATVLRASELGDPETLVSLTATGASTIEWSETSETYVTTPWGDSALAGAVEVCSQEFNGMHAVATLGSDLRTVRLYRYDNAQILLSTFVSAHDVHDIEVFMGTNNLPYIAAASATRVKCYSVNGSLVWSWPCNPVDLAVLPGSGIGNARLAILETFGNFTIIDTCSEAGLLTSDNVTAAAPPGTLNQLLFADENNDGELDALVKSDQGVQVFVNTQTVPVFNTLNTDPLFPWSYSGDADTVTGAGPIIRLLTGTDGSDKISWPEIATTAALQGGIDGISLGQMTDDPLPGPSTTLKFTLQVSNALLSNYVRAGSETRFEFHAWLGDSSNNDIAPGTLFDEHLKLVNPLANGTGTSEWNVKLVLPTELKLDLHWEPDHVYYVSTRIVEWRNGRTRQASPPITLGISASLIEQAVDPQFPFLHSVSSDFPIGFGELPGPGPCALSDLFDEAYLRGIVVGVVTTLPHPSVTGATTPPNTIYAGESHIRVSSGG